MITALVKVKSHDDVARVVTERMVRVPGIVRTHTISAFRVYAKADGGTGPTPGER